MKAKDYAKLYDNLRTKEEMVGFYDLFLKEMQDVGAARGTKTNEGICGLLSEFRAKWLAICNLRPELPKTMFDQAVIYTFGEATYRSWRGEAADEILITIMRITRTKY